MNFINDLSIKRKLLLYTIVTSGTALTLAFIALFYHEQRSFKQDMVENLSSQATMLAGLGTAALTFDDSDTATEMLEELRHEPHIAMAVIYREGRPFAAYRRPDVFEPYPRTVPTDLEANFIGQYLSVIHKIDFKGHHLGEIYLQADMTQLRQRLWDYLAILVGVLITSIFVVFLLATRLLHVITRPILSLSQAAHSVTEDQDYSVRAKKMGKDEMGALTDSFNQMLSRIQAQDIELKTGRERYEIAVMGSSDGIWDWELDGQQIYFSPRWKEMIGFEEGELPNEYKAWEERLHPDDREATLEQLKDYLDGKHDVYEVEFRLRHKDGSYRWILSRGVALRDSHGHAYRLAGSHTDITHRKEAEQKMQEMHQQLVQTSRQAGMAEVATGVLHNVGNVLNSVNVSATLVAQRTRQSKLINLRKAAQLMEDQGDAIGAFMSRDAKGKMLPDYLSKLSGHLEKEQKENLKELEALTTNIEHIKQIVSMQQNYSKVSGVMEPIQPVELVEDAFRINSLGFSRHRIQVKREFTDVPTIMVDKHNVLQILVNLMSNAKHALKSKEGDERVVTLKVGYDAVKERVCISVRDNGIGITKENLNSIFRHGFTTKKDGHGFGLHSGALAAKQMGGELTVGSDGPGQGAVFTLEVPPADTEALAKSAA